MMTDQRSIYTGELVTDDNKAGGGNPYTKTDEKGRDWANRATLYGDHLLKYLLRIAVKHGRGPEIAEYLTEYRIRHARRSGNNLVNTSWHIADNVSAPLNRIDRIEYEVSKLKDAAAHQLNLFG